MVFYLHLTVNKMFLLKLLIVFSGPESRPNSPACSFMNYSSFCFLIGDTSVNLKMNMQLIAVFLISKCIMLL